MTQNKFFIFFLLGVIASLTSAPSAFSLTTLKQVQVSNGSQIDLLFDGKVSKNQIHTEFINDTIQISLTDSAVYPAKISSVNGGSITKVFAYQYAPKLVRCRLSVKGKAESFKDHLQISPSGRMLTVRLGVEPKAAAVKAKAPVVEAEEKALLEQVLKSPIEAPAKAPVKAEVEPIAVAAPVPKPALKEEILGRPERPASLAGGKSLPSPLFAFGKLAIVLGIFGLVALAVKKVLTEKQGQSSPKGLFGAISRFAQSNLGKNGQKSKTAIEVLSTHYLGPKKSISVVKIGSRTLVLGVTNESINLITQLSDGIDSLSEMDAQDLGEEPSAVFSNLLSNESTRRGTSTGSSPKKEAPTARASTPVRGYGSEPSMSVTAKEAPAAIDVLAATITPQTGVRSQIRSRLEGFKSL